jgi:hypothetical protein
LHDNAKPHTAVSIKQFLEEQGIPKLNHTPIISRFIPTSLLLIPQNQIHTEKGEDLKTQMTLKETQQRNCWHYMQMSSKSVSNNFMIGHKTDISRGLF